MTYDPEIDRRGVAECDAYEAAFYVRLDAYGARSEACLECKRWRDMQHPLQSSCDDHSRELRQLHASQSDSRRQSYAATQRLEAYEAGRVAFAPLLAAARAIRGRWEGALCITMPPCGGCDACRFEAALAALDEVQP